MVRDTVGAFDTTCTLKAPLAANSDYYWRVNAQNIGGASAYLDREALLDRNGACR